jgi:hypothetical protein
VFNPAVRPSCADSLTFDARMGQRARLVRLPIDTVHRAALADKEGREPEGEGCPYSAADTRPVAGRDVIARAQLQNGNAATI